MSMFKQPQGAPVGIGGVGDTKSSPSVTLSSIKESDIPSSTNNNASIPSAMNSSFR